MAVRLSVIMVHTPPRGSAAQGLSEAIVGELIGLPGIDVMLIGPIESLGETSTDRLSLDAITGDVAVLDWQPPDRTIAALASVGFMGHRAPHASDSAATPADGARRIYGFDLSRFPSAGEVVTALRGLRDHRQVRTVSLSMSPSTGRPSPPTSPTHSPPPTEPIPSPDPSSDSRQTVDPANSIDLDHLLDQLDELDP